MFLGKNKGKALQGAAQDNLIWSSQWKEIPWQARSSNAGAKHLAPTALPSWAGAASWAECEHQCEHPPLLSSLAALPASPSLELWAGGEGGCRDGGVQGSRAGTVWAALDPVLCLSSPHQGTGNGGQGANGTEAKGFSKGVAFLLKTNSIRNTLMETRLAPTQPGRTKGHTGLAATLQVRGLHPGPLQLSRQKQEINTKKIKGQV